jgi:mRNA interferase MazF
MEVNRFEVWLVSPDPVVGSEIKKIRPCMIVSPNEANNSLSTVTIVPMTTTIRSYPTRLACNFKGKSGQLAIDQVKTVDKRRLQKNLGIMTAPTANKCIDVLLQYFQH